MNICNKANKMFVCKRWAELIKAQSDGKKLQLFKSCIGGWADEKLDEEYMKRTSPDLWRIKPETEFPAYRRSKSYGFIAKFADKRTYRVVMSALKDHKIGSVVTKKTAHCDNEDFWEPVDTVEINGQIFYDTQPVLISSKYHPAYVVIQFIDAKNKGFFSSDGERIDLPTEAPEKIEACGEVAPMIINAWQKLKI